MGCGKMMLGSDKPIHERIAPLTCIVDRPSVRGELSAVDDTSQRRIFICSKCLVGGENMDILRKEFARCRQKYHRDTSSRFLSRSALRAVIWAKTNGRCWYCGKDTNPFRDFSIDHLEPGENDDFDNLVPCCRYCNCAKSNKNLREFRTILAGSDNDTFLFFFEVGLS